jgi:hypothetical protein
MAKLKARKGKKKASKRLSGRGFSKATKSKLKKVAKITAGAALALTPLAMRALEQRRQGARQAQLEDYRTKIRQGLAQSREADRQRAALMAQYAQELAQKYGLGRQ